MTIHVNFHASKVDEELYDTVFFLGLPFKRTKGEYKGKKAYHYETELFQLTIMGREIKINGESFKSCAMAKKYLQRYA